MNVVALLAHPDDELMCAGTLAKFVDDDADVTIVTAFSDHRSPELHQSAKTLGVRLIERYAAQLDFTWNQATVRRYEPLVCDQNPDLLLSHRVSDNNTSHVPLAQTMRTIARKNNVSLWEIDSALPGGIETDGASNNCLIDIDQQYERKYAAIDCYESVAQQYPGLRAGFESRDLHNGWLLHMDTISHYAEAMRVVKSVWL